MCDRLGMPPRDGDGCVGCVCDSFCFVLSRIFSVVYFIVDNCCAGICGMFLTKYRERLVCDRNTIMFSGGVVIVVGTSAYSASHCIFTIFTKREFARYRLPVAFGILKYQVQK